MSQLKNLPRIAKPAKPYPDFPLFPHGSGRWAKKIRGKLHYFGYWARKRDGQLQKLPGETWRAALDQYLEQTDDLHAGRKPRPADTGFTIRDMLNAYLTSQHSKVESGDITPRTFSDCERVCKRIASYFGLGRSVGDLRPEDFGAFRHCLATEDIRPPEQKKGGGKRTRSKAALADIVNRAKAPFRYARDNGLIDAIRFGSEFRPPSRKLIRKERQNGVRRDFSREEILAILSKVNGQLKAMVLLGVNAGLSNADVGELRLRHLDFETGWLNYPREKTAVERRVPLWPETVSAVRHIVETRRVHRDPADEDLVFLTAKGNSWHKRTGSGDNPITKQLAKVLKALGVHRHGVGFYGFRRTLETVGGEIGDQVAVDYLMGHSPDQSDMSAVYRERIGDDRLSAVTDHVRTWLFPPEQSEEDS